MKLILVVNLLATSVVSFSFEFIFKNYSFENGLPSSEVYNSFQDRNGNIWFCTDNGIARYDGREFMIVDINNGLPENVVFNFFVQPTGEVWLSTAGNELWKFNPLKFPIVFRPYKYNDRIKEALSSNMNKKYFRKVLFVNGELYASFMSNAGFLKVDPSGKANLIETERLGETPVNLNVLIHIRYIDGNPFISSELFKSASESNGSIYLLDHEKNDTIDPGIVYKNMIQPNWGISDYLVNESGLTLLSSTYIINYFKGVVKVMELPYEPLRIEADDEFYYILSFKGGYIFDKNWNFEREFLSEHLINDMIIDVDGGIWFCTYQNGVYYSKNKRIKKLKDPESKILVPRKIYVNHKHILVVTHEKDLFVYDKRGNLIEVIHGVRYENGFYSSDSDLSLYFAGNEFPNSDYDSYYHLESGNIHFYKVRERTLFKFHRDKKWETFNIEIPNMHMVSQLNDSILLAATDEGLYKITNYVQAEPYPSKNSLLKVPARTICQFRSGHLLGTLKNGLIYIKDSIIYNLTVESGLLSNYVKHLLVEDDHRIWLGSNYGLTKIEIGERITDLNIRNITKEEGILSNEIVDLFTFNDTIWVGSKHGICTFSSAEHFDFVLNKDFFGFDSLLIGKKPTDVNADTINCEFGSELDFHFSVRSFFNEKLIEFEYFISDHFKGWEKSDQNHIRIGNLSPGIHNLQIRPVNYRIDNGFLLEKTLFIASPFWMTWWFITLMLIVFFGFLLLIFRFILFRLNKQKQKELDKLKLELKALIAQMNPHFTFNTINSIQHYIIKKDKKEALNYLAEFALLMRRTLEYSRREFIDLQEEINFLRLYAELENKRFDKPFHLSIKLECQTPLYEIEIPALLIQPLVENAIIHGVAPLKDKQGIIEISFNEFPKFFIVKISDNGYGKKSKKIKLTGKKNSYGSDIIRQRLKIYNSTHYRESDLSFSFADKSEEDLTTVTIRIYKNEG